MNILTRKIVHSYLGLDTDDECNLFVAKEKELQTIDEILDQDQFVHLHGKPGSGKSSLASRYAFSKYKNEMFTICWFDASFYVNINIELRALLHDLTERPSVKSETKLLKNSYVIDKTLIIKEAKNIINKKFSYMQFLFIFDDLRDESILDLFYMSFKRNVKFLIISETKLEKYKFKTIEVMNLNNDDIINAIRKKVITENDQADNSQIIVSCTSELDNYFGLSCNRESGSTDLKEEREELEKKVKQKCQLINDNRKAYDRISKIDEFDNDQMNLLKYLLCFDIDQVSLEIIEGLFKEKSLCSNLLNQLITKSIISETPFGYCLSKSFKPDEKKAFLSRVHDTKQVLEKLIQCIVDLIDEQKFRELMSEAAQNSDLKLNLQNIITYRYFKYVEENHKKKYEQFHRLKIRDLENLSFSDSLVNNK